MMEAKSDLCISTSDPNGMPYGARLKRARESAGKSAVEVAKLLGLTRRDYDEWEAYEGELNMATSLRELSKIAGALGIRTSAIFDDGPSAGPPIHPEELCKKLRTHLDATGTNVEEFENRVGFEIAPALADWSKVLDWNLDCLRFVCKELGIDWHLALPDSLLGTGGGAAASDYFGSG